MAAGPVLPKELHIAAIQTAIPQKVTEPGRRPRRIIAAAAAPLLFQSRLRIVLYYKRSRNMELEEAAAAEEEEEAREKAAAAAAEAEAWTVAAWIRESMCAALAESPGLAGRLRRRAGEGGGWEVKPNDAGVRLVQAAVADVSMAQFLAADGTEKEAALAYWVDVDEETPDFSALFYVQVTQFQRDGYAIGISCSLLLADPLFLIQFLKSWAQAQTQMLDQGLFMKIPIFHLGNFQKPTHTKHLKSIPFPCAPVAAAATATVLFKISYNGGRGEPPYSAIASACLEEAAGRIKSRTVDKFYLMINGGADDPRDVRVESCTRAEVPPPPLGLRSDGSIKAVRWDEFGLEGLALAQGNKPIHVSYHMVSPPSSSTDEGLVVIMSPPSKEKIKGVLEMMISVTIPKK